MATEIVVTVELLNQLVQLNEKESAFWKEHDSDGLANFYEGKVRAFQFILGMLKVS